MKILGIDTTFLLILFVLFIVAIVCASKVSKKVNVIADNTIERYCEGLNFGE